MGFVRVMTVDDLWDGEMQSVEVEHQSVLLVKINNVVYAYEDRCPHQGVPLSQGYLSNSVLTCCAHHWQYEMCTGCGINPKSAQLKSFPVEIRAGAIFINVNDKGEEYDFRK